MPTASPSPAADGFFEPDKLLFYTAMARESGWGKDIPEMLRNEDWNYAAFTTAQAAAARPTRRNASPATSRSTR